MGLVPIWARFFFQLPINLNGQLDGTDAAPLTGSRRQAHPWNARLGEPCQPGGTVWQQLQQRSQKHIAGTARGTL